MWKSKGRIKINTLIEKEIDGGLNIIDIESKLNASKASWIPRLMNTNSSLFHFINQLFEMENISLSYICILKTNLTNVEDYEELKLIPRFYIKESFCAFNTCKMIKDLSRMSTYEFLSLPIWKNKFFEYKNMTVYFENWIKAGILYTKDLYE